MKNLALLATLVFGLFSGIGFSQVNCITDAWDETGTLHPPECYPFPNSVFGRTVPAAVQADPLSFALTDSKLYTDDFGFAYWGAFPDPTSDQFIVTIKGDGDDQQDQPIHYGNTDDPVFKIDTCCTQGSGSPENPLNKLLRIPENRKWGGHSGSSADSHFCVISTDATLHPNGRAIGCFFKGSQAEEDYFTTTVSGCGTIGNPCLLSDYATTSFIQTGNVVEWGASGTDVYQLNPGEGSALRIAGLALAVTSNEVIEEDIRHAFFITPPCHKNDSVYTLKTENLFPAFPQDGGHGDLSCDEPEFDAMPPWASFYGNALSPNNVWDMPPHGAHSILAFTEAQIAALEVGGTSVYWDGSITAIPKPQTTYMRAWRDYGAFEGDTKAVCCPGHTIRHGPSTDAEEQAGQTPDIWSYLDGEGITYQQFPSDPTRSTRIYSFPILGGVPDMNGPNCPAPGAFCSPFDSIVYLDPCVARFNDGLDVSDTACSSLTGAPAPDKLTITTQPVDFDEDTTLGTTVQVQLSEDDGTPITTSGVNVTAVLDDFEGNGATLTVTSPDATNASGIAEYSDISIDIPGEYRILFDAVDYDSVLSDNFTVNSTPTPTPGGTITVVGTPGQTLFNNHTTDARQHVTDSITCPSSKCSMIAWSVVDSNAAVGSMSSDLGGGFINISRVWDTTGGSGTLEVWWDPDIASDGVHTLTHSLGWPHPAIIGHITLSGVDTNDAYSAVSASSLGTPGTSATVTVGEAANELIIDFAAPGRSADPGTITFDMGQTEIDKDCITDTLPNTLCGGASYYTSAGASETPGASWSNSAKYNYTAVAIKPAITAQWTYDTGDALTSTASGTTITWTSELAGTCDLVYYPAGDDTLEPTPLTSVTCTAETATVKLPQGNHKLGIEQSSSGLDSVSELIYVPGVYIP